MRSFGDICHWRTTRAVVVLGGGTGVVGRWRWQFYYDQRQSKQLADFGYAPPLPHSVTLTAHIFAGMPHHTTQPCLMRLDWSVCVVLSPLAPSCVLLDAAALIDRHVLSLSLGTAL